MVPPEGHVAIGVVVDHIRKRDQAIVYFAVDIDLEASAVEYAAGDRPIVICVQVLRSGRNEGLVQVRAA